MKTKLEIGKEYWLDNLKDESGTFIGLDGGTILFKPSKNCVSYLLRNGYVIFGDSGREYCEVVSEKPWSFTTPIAMKCTEEQFNGIKDKLVEMGYKTNGFETGSGYLCTNYNKVKNRLEISGNTINQPTKFESFNPDLFLALAAMTDKEDGIKGEWWIGTSSGKLFKQTIEKSLNTSGVIRKATAQEIIEHFERKEFLLPKFWHVVVTEENVDVLSKWRFGEEYPKHKLNIGYIVGFSSWQNSKQHNPSDSRGRFGSEITSDQFKKYVLKETTQSCQIISIPPTKQATLFDDRVEITDWKPKEGDFVFYVAYWNDEFRYTNTFYNDNFKKEFKNGFIKRTESEAKQLVEKLKQAML